MGNIHSINIGGSTYVIEPKTVKINDVRGADRPTSYFADYTLTPWFNEKTGFSTSWASGITMKGWTNDYQSWQLAAGSTSSLQPELKFRNGINDAWRPWKKVILEGDAATKAQQADKIAIHTKEFIQDSGLCSLDGMYEVPVILGGCDCTIFSDQPDADYFGLMTDYHPQNNNSNWLRYNFNDQTLKSTNFEGNLTGDVTGNASSSTTVNVTTKSTAGSFPLIFGPSTTTGGAFMPSGNKSLYMDSANNLYYNPSTNDLTVHSGYIIMPMDDKKGIMPATNNYGQVGFSDRKFWKMHASTFVGNLSGNATTATTATNANYIEVNATSTNAAYYLTFVNGTDGNRKTYVNSGITVNPATDTINTNISGNVTGNLTGRVLPKTTSITAIETTYTGIAGIEYHSTVSRYQNGNNYYAGTAYGFPATSNANGVLNIETHAFGGASYYLHQIGFSSDNRLYHRAFHGNNPNSVSSTPSNQNGKTWNSIPLCKPSNFGQVRNIEVVTSMPSSPNSYTLYLVLG